MGLAYASDDGLASDGYSVFVAGTRTLADWARNPRIPLGLTSTLPRYEALRTAVSSSGAFKRAHRLVGHSMGGSVVLQLAKDRPSQFVTETYGAPVFSFSSSERRHRDLFDPVSILDFGADSRHFTIPHSYKGSYN
jgi:pimeloyl-ACP methyl ester carboxylesterase